MTHSERTRPTVLIFLPDIFSARNFLFTPLWDHLVAAKDVNFVMVSSIPANGEYVAAQRIPNVRWELMGRSPGSKIRYLLSPFLHSPSPSSLRRMGEILLGWLAVRIQYEIHVRLIYRFNHLKGFKTHRLKLNLPGNERRKLFGEFRYLGWPLPGKEMIFDWLYRLYNASWWPAPEWLASLFESYQPDLILIAFPQTLPGFMVNRMAQSAGVPVIAYINSWDQPTTKGPLPRGIRHIMVWNQQMRQELIDFHSIPAEHISVVGGVHLDLYFQDDLFLPRDAFLQSLGIDPARKLIVYGTYSERLGPDEPAVARHVAEQVVAAAYAEPVTLLIRPHPKDQNWQTRLGALDSLPNVQVRRSSSFGADREPDAVQGAIADLKHLVNLMKHADVVLNGPGTLALDAIAFDTPVISVGFDGDRQLPYDRSILFRYDFDHYAKVIEAEGTWLVKSYEELDEAINAYLENPALDAAGRRRIRQEQLAPFDGRAGERIVTTIRSMIRK